MKTTANRRVIDGRQPDAASIARAAGIIQDGGAVIFPTHCLYGLAVRADSVDAVARLYAIKQRSAQKPVSLLIGDAGKLDDLVQTVSPSARRLMACFWPGRITLVFEAGATVVPGLTAGTATIGIRLPQHPVAAALAAATGTITATSANVSGFPGVASVDELPPELLARVDMVLDAGHLAGGAGSTVVDVSGPAVRVFREGVISANRVHQCLASPPG